MYKRQEENAKKIIKRSGHLDKRQEENGNRKIRRRSNVSPLGLHQARSRKDKRTERVQTIYKTKVNKRR